MKTIRNTRIKNKHLYIRLDNIRVDLDLFDATSNMQGKKTSISLSEIIKLSIIVLNIKTDAVLQYQLVFLHYNKLNCIRYCALIGKICPWWQIKQNLKIRNERTQKDVMWKCWNVNLLKSSVAFLEGNHHCGKDCTWQKIGQNILYYRNSLQR